ncbi:MAG: hypothetical protein GC164_00835 [Phycisphaera sp.]|nr:hypothetical protein [Phycisphaera sp.]
MPDSPTTCLTRTAAAIAALLWLPCFVFAQGAPAQPVAQAKSPVGIKAPDHFDYIKVADVRVGMKGYGMSVFHGVKIEPFAVEVVSVEHGFAPGLSVVWVRCPDERMQHSGPVQGMSGSPIYLWSDNEPHELGKGGKMLGAFAFGFGMTRDCYVGVQPIEQMISVADRATGDPEKILQQASAKRCVTANEFYRDLIAGGEAARVSPVIIAQTRAIARLFPSFNSTQPTADPTPHGPEGMSGSVRSMMLPIQVGSQELATLTQPWLNRLGFTAMAGPMGTMAGKPPEEWDVKNTPIEPGSVLAIPLAFGDMDLSAVGTTTAVLPDGRVLAFGHAMFGEGDTAVPMAGGFVHTVMPQFDISFKLAGSGVIRGAVVRDENSGIVGRSDGLFQSAPVDVTIKYPNSDPMDYHFQAVHNRNLSPAIAGMLPARCLEARQSTPELSTLTLHAQMKFVDNREITINTVVPGGSMRDVFMAIASRVGAMVMNPYEPSRLTSMKATVEVEPGIRSATILDGRLMRSEVAPGQELDVVVRYQPYGKDITTRRIKVPIPQSLPEGQYNLTICDAMTYEQMIFYSRPHLMQITSLNDLMDTMKMLDAINPQAMYALLELPEQGVAVGRQELPMLPSSKRAMVQSPTSPQATPFSSYVKVIEPMDQVMEGAVTFNVTVKPSFQSAGAAAGE